MAARSCRQCRELIEKDALRVAIEPDADPMSMANGLLHPRRLRDREGRGARPAGEAPLNALTLHEVEGFIKEGHFPAGSMGPKMAAMYRFLKAGGRRGLITSPDLLGAALEGRAGTHFIGRM